MHTLLKDVSAGNWDNVAGRAEDIAAALSSVQPLAIEVLGETQELCRLIESVLDLLQSALETCKERQNQITPLMNALDIIDARKEHR